MKRILLISLLAALVMALVVSAASSAFASPLAPKRPDPGAPPGAPRTWLPLDPWVQQHWFPFDEDRLYAALGMGRDDIRASFRADPGATLAVFARRRGLEPSHLIESLLAPRRAEVSPKMYSELRRRSWMLFTHPHLGGHMVGHTFHTRTFNQRLPGILGESHPAIAALRARGLSYMQMGLRNGRRPQWVHDQLVGVFRDSVETGIRLRATSAVEGKRWLSFQLGELPGLLGKGWEVSPADEAATRALHQVSQPARIDDGSSSRPLYCVLTH